MAFTEEELTNQQDLVKSIIDRELGNAFTIKLDKTKRPIVTEQELADFLNNHLIYEVLSGTEWVCITDKKGIVAALGFVEADNRVVVTHFVERMGFHVERAIGVLCDLLKDSTVKPLFIKLKADHGSLYHKTLNAYQYKFLFLSEPTNNDGGWAIFAPETQLDNSAILAP